MGPGNEPRPDHWPAERADRDPCSFAISARRISAEASIRALPLAGRAAHPVAPGGTAPARPPRSAWREQSACFTIRCDRPPPRRVLPQCHGFAPGRIEGECRMASQAADAVTPSLAATVAERPDTTRRVPK